MGSPSGAVLIVHPGYWAGYFCKRAKADPELYSQAFPDLAEIRLRTSVGVCRSLLTLPSKGQHPEQEQGRQLDPKPHG